jgi:hypothetical protein
MALLQLYHTLPDDQMDQQHMKTPDLLPAAVFLQGGGLVMALLQLVIRFPQCLLRFVV